jgi:hypothetical protein
MFEQHPLVATCKETRLFDRYIRDLHETWRNDEGAVELSGTGLCGVITGEEFYDWCAEFALRVIDKIHENNPDALAIVEKTPMHVFRGPLILKLLPNARFLHVIRDPRSVVSSLRAASGSFGKLWAPASITQASRTWVESVRAGRAIGELTERYREVRYEDLLGESAATRLEGLFEWLNLPADSSLAPAIVRQCSLENMRKADADTHSGAARLDRGKGFYRKGKADSWRTDLSSAEITLVEYITGNLMGELNYKTASPSRNRRIPARFLMYKTAEALEWRLHKGIGRVFGRLRALT